MSANIEDEVPCPDQLANKRLPFGAPTILADAEGRKPIVTGGNDLVGRLAFENIHDMHRSVALPNSIRNLLPMSQGAAKEFEARLRNENASQNRKKKIKPACDQQQLEQTTHVRVTDYSQYKFLDKVKVLDKRRLPCAFINGESKQISNLKFQISTVRL